MKKKSLAALLSGLLTVSLTGVGFASWIIVQGDTKQVTGTVNVETISDKTTTITYDWANNNGKNGANEISTETLFGDDQFSFGSNKTTNTGWLRSTDTKGEVLSLELNVHVQNSEYLTSASSVSLTVNSTKMTEAGVNDEESEKTGYQWAVAKKYIQEFTASIKEGSFDDEFVVVISTGWGEKFDTNNASTTATGDTNADDNLNPYDYYNDRSSVDYAGDARDTLKLLQLYLSSVTFTLTINASVTAA